MNNRDEILEAAALEIEGSSLLDMSGAWSKTKKGQREYEARMKAVYGERKRCADIIRAMKSGSGLDPIERLRQIAELPQDHRQDLYLTDAWPMAWKGWLDIECRIKLNSNSAPPQSEYRITLTDEGRAILAGERG